MKKWYTTKELSKLLGVSRRSVRRRANKKGWNWQFVKTPNGRNMKKYKLTDQDIQNLNTSNGDKNFVVVNSPRQHKRSDGQILNNFIKQSEKKVKQYKNRFIDITLKEYLPSLIVFISDNHIGPSCFLKRMMDDSKLIRDTDGAYAILGGDGWDNNIKHISAMVNSSSKPSDEYKAFRAYLKIFSHKIITMISGNHDGWTKDRAGIDMVDSLSEQLNIPYSPNWKAVTRIHFAKDIEDGQGSFSVIEKEDEDFQKKPYVILTQHKSQYESSINPEHACRTTIQREKNIDADICFIGHKHVIAAFPFMLHGRERWGLRSGSYKIDDWAEQHGYTPDPPTCPAAVIYPGKHKKIIGFKDLRDATRFLKVEREHWKRSNASS